MLRTTLILALSLFTLGSIAQEVVQSGKMYKGGEKIYDPQTGTTMTIPEHWRGYGTLDVEMLTLNSDTSNASLRIFGVQDNLVSIKNRLPSGVELAPGVVIKPKGEITFGDNILSTELFMTNDPNISGYYFVKCGDYGNCIGFLFGASTKTHELYFDALNEMLHEVTLGQPTQVEPGEDFNWSKELSDKHLFHYESNNTGIMGNQVWLCENGTFTAKLKRKGMFKEGQQGRIRGNQSGTFHFEGVGKQGVLVMKFDKYKDQEFRLDTEYREGDIYINGIKYFKAIHTKCR